MASTSGISHSTENHYSRRRLSLVDLAKEETARNKEAEEWLTKEIKTDDIQDFDLTEEEIFLLSTLPNEETDPNTINLMFSVSEKLSALQNILKVIESCGGQVQHVETRQSKQEPSFDILVKVTIKKNELLKLIKTVRQGDNVSVSIMGSESSCFKKIWFPKHVSELDHCNKTLSKVEPDLDSGHPGFSDPIYRARRRDIALLSMKYKYGQPITRVEYTKEEIQTWRAFYIEMKSQQEKHACSTFKKTFKILEKEGLYSPDFIPQLEDVSNFLKKCSGFTLRPASGLLTARDFLASLAFRVFQSTQYIRHGSSPNHTPEPDCIHELMGHVPMFADPSFARFSQEIGLASLMAQDEEIEKLSSIYWFTIEFGLCKEDGGIKAYGAALLSSYGELEHALSGKPSILPFEPKTTSVQPYQDYNYQDVYYVAESFEDAKEKIRNYVSTYLPHACSMTYDPFTESVYQLDSLEKIERMTQYIKSDVSVLTNAIQRLQSH